MRDLNSEIKQKLTEKQDFLLEHREKLKRELRNVELELEAVERVLTTCYEVDQIIEPVANPVALDAMEKQVIQSLLNGSRG